MFANGRIAVALLQQTLRRRFERQIVFLRARLSAEGLFGLHLTMGGIAIIAGAWLFGGVAEDLITGDPLTVFDVVVSDWFKDHATPSFTVWMARVSDLASPSAVLGLCIVGSMVLLWKRQWYALIALILAVPGGIGLNLLLKMMFARTRPGWGSVDLWGFSFPSGHTMTVTLLYGFIAVFCLVFVAPSWFGRALSVVLFLLIVGAVGFSRIYLGAHYFSAKHFFFEDMLKADKSFKSREELAPLADSRGVSAEKDIIVYCRLSHRATVLYFALTELLGLENVRVYDGSWTEWGNLVGVPVER